MTAYFTSGDKHAKRFRASAHNYNSPQSAPINLTISSANLICQPELYVPLHKPLTDYILLTYPVESSEDESQVEKEASPTAQA